MPEFVQGISKVITFINYLERQNELLRCTDYYCEQARSLFGPILANAQFTDMEFAALFALSVWQIGLFPLMKS